MMALGVAAPAVWPTIGGIMVAAFLVGARRATGLRAMMTAAFATGQIAGPLLASAAPG
jgi:hypothetical protein